MNHRIGLTVEHTIRVGAGRAPRGIEDIPMTITEPLPRVYVTLAEAAEMLAYKSTRTIERKIKAGELEARGDGRGRRVVYASVLRHPDYQAEERAE